MKYFYRSCLLMVLLSYSSLLFAQKTWKEWEKEWKEWVAFGVDKQAIYESCVTKNGNRIDWPDNFVWDDWDVRFEDPLAEEFDKVRANTIDGLARNVLEGRNCIEDMITNHLSGKVKFNSGFRPIEYHEHFKDIKSKYKWIKNDITPECRPLKTYYMWQHGKHALGKKVAEKSLHSTGKAIDISRKPKNTSWSPLMTCQSNQYGGECCHNSVFQWCTDPDPDEENGAYMWELCRNQLEVNDGSGIFPMKCTGKKISGYQERTKNCVMKVNTANCISVTPPPNMDYWYECDYVEMIVDYCYVSEKDHPKLTLDMIAELCGLYNPFPKSHTMHFIERP